MKIYRIKRAHCAYDVEHPGRAFWDQANIADVNTFLWYEAGEKWHAEAQLLYDESHLYFRMVSQDRHIVGVHTKPNQPVCQDSCAEFFVTPGSDPALGYFNYEINCVGTMLLAYGTGRQGRIYVRPELAKQVAIWHSIPGSSKQEESDDCAWEIQAAIPFAVMRAYVEFPAPQPGTEWRGNFYRCADESSNPQWSCWNAIKTEHPDYHRSEFFGRLLFA